MASNRLEKNQGGSDVYAAAVAATDVSFEGGRVPSVGDVRAFNDGREFVFCSSEVDIEPGEIAAMASCQVTPIDNSCTAAAIGATEVTIDTTGVAMFGGSAGVIAADRLAGGYLMIQDDAGEGNHYRIKSNTAGTASASITLTLYDRLKVALTTASDVVLVGPRYRKVVLGTATLQPVGVAMTQVTAATDGEEQFFWAQTKGPGVVYVKTGTSLAVGKTAAAGADGGIVVGAGSGTEIPVGVCLATDTTNGAFMPICLNIPA